MLLFENFLALLLAFDLLRIILVFMKKHLQTPSVSLERLPCSAASQLLSFRRFGSRHDPTQGMNGGVHAPVGYYFYSSLAFLLFLFTLRS